MKKRYASLLIMIVLSAFFALGAAAALPEKAGRVQDLAHLLEKGQGAAIEKIAAADKPAFYILTVDNMGGLDSLAYTTQVYDKWELEQGEVLLVISSEERRIEMQFDIPELQEALDALPADYDGNADSTASSITKFINRHFIPFAKEGDFGKAMKELMSETKAVYVQHTADSEPAKEAVGAVPPVAASPPDTPQQPTKQETSELPQTPASPKKGLGEPEPKNPLFSLNPVLAWTWIGAFILLFIAYRFYIAFKKKRNIARELSRIDGLLVESHHASERLRPFIGLMQGETAQIVKQSEQAIAVLMVSLSQLQAEWSDRPLPAIMAAKLDDLYYELLGSLIVKSEELAYIIENINRISEADKSIKEKLERLHTLFKQSETKLNDLLENTGFPLTTLVGLLGSLGKELEYAEQLEAFDPIAAVREVKGSKIDARELQIQIDAVDFFYKKYFAFASTASSHRNEIEHITKTNSIELAIARLQPELSIANSIEANESMKLALQDGNMADVNRFAERSDQLLAEALEMTQRQVKLKDLNQQTIRYLNAKLQPFRAVIGQIEALLLVACAKYTAPHWTGVEAGFLAVRKLVQEAANELPQIKLWSSDTHQDYERAFGELEKWLRRFDEIESDLTRFLTELQQLDIRLSNARQQAEDGLVRRDQGLSIVRGERLVIDWEQGAEEIETNYRQISSLLITQPLHLTAIEADLDQYHQHIDLFLQYIDHRLQEKLDAHRRLDELSSRYHIYVREYKSKIRIRRYSPHFKTIRGEAERLIGAGMYVEAFHQAAQLQGLVDAMHRDYREVLDSERIRRLNRQAAASSSFHNSSGASSSRSSSSSFWGNSSSKSTSRSNGNASWNNSSSNVPQPNNTTRSNSSSSSSSNSGGGSSGGSSGSSGGSSGRSSGGSNW
ncbi:hypothetical protein EBB07_25615 [Paenibacillaceae bacterium]|nr:hypothetical protein EBB07_25615 [Paenibacillaceae bacterium]